jgi:hypothetical protein
MSIQIFKHDSSVPEDIQDLKTLIERETNVFNYVYENLAFRNVLPSDFAEYDIDPENLTLHDVEIAVQKSAVILFSTFFLVVNAQQSVDKGTIHVIQFDKPTGDIFVYNLSRTDDTKDLTNDILDMIEGTGELAQDADLYEALAYKTSLQSFLKFVLSHFSEFKDITDDDIDAICFHMGYNTFDKKVLN